MRRIIAMLVGISALIGTIVPPALFMTQQMSHSTMQQIMLAACVAWFVAAPFWMKETAS